MDGHGAKADFKRSCGILAKSVPGQMAPDPGPWTKFRC